MIVFPIFHIFIQSRTVPAYYIFFSRFDYHFPWFWYVIVLTKIIAKTCEQLEQNLPGKETQQPLAVWKALRWVRRKVLYITLKPFFCKQIPSLLIALKPLLQKGMMAKLWKWDPSYKQPKLFYMHRYTKYFPISFFPTLTHIYYILLFMLLSYSAFMNFVSQNDAICRSFLFFF